MLLAKFITKQVSIQDQEHGGKIMGLQVTLKISTMSQAG
jgi:hypothetical protein